MFDVWILAYAFGIVGTVLFIYLLFADDILHYRLRRHCKKYKDGGRPPECGTYEFAIKKKCINCGSNGVVRKVYEDEYGNLYISFKCNRCDESINIKKYYRRR